MPAKHCTVYLNWEDASQGHGGKMQGDTKVMLCHAARTFDMLWHIGIHCLMKILRKVRLCNLGQK